MLWKEFPARAPETTRGARVLPQSSGANEASCRLSRRDAANTRHRRVATGGFFRYNPNFLAGCESTRYNSVYGLWRSFNHLDYPRWTGYRRDREVVDAGERSGWLYHYDSSRHRGRARRHLDWSPFYGRKLCRWLDHVGCRSNDPVVAISIAFQARRVAFTRFCSHALGKKRRQAAALQSAMREKCDGHSPTLYHFNPSTFNPSTFQRFNVSTVQRQRTFALSRECEMIIAPWPRRKER